MEGGKSLEQRGSKGRQEWKSGRDKEVCNVHKGGRYVTMHIQICESSKLKIEIVV